MTSLNTLIDHPIPILIFPITLLISNSIILPLGYGGVDFEFPDGFRLTLEGGAGVVIGGNEGDQLNWPLVSALFALGRFMP